MNSHVGNWSPGELPNVQRVIARVKTQWLKKFFIPLKNYWNEHVLNEFASPIWNLKHKLWPKEGSGVKLEVWLPTTKNQESPRFPCVQVVCNILLESSERGLQLFLDLISIGGLHTKLWGPKVVGVWTLAILGLSLESPGTKSHLDVGLMERDRVYYKGEGGGFPQVWVVVSLVSLSCPWLVLAPKVF
jgi:hypothetical protein